VLGFDTGNPETSGVVRVRFPPPQFSRREAAFALIALIGLPSALKLGTLGIVQWVAPDVPPTRAPVDHHRSAGDRESSRP